MENADRQSLTRNLTALIDRTQFDSTLESKLVEKNVFTTLMLERIRAGDGDSHSQKRKLFTEVQKRGPQAFKSLIEALIESGNVTAALVLDPNPDFHEIEGLNNSKVWNAPTYSATPPSVTRAAAPVPPVWHNNTTPLTVKVTRSGSALCVQSPHHSAIRHYTMESKPRGLALIINNDHFDNDVLSTRTGSQVDSNNLDELFLQLGFEVTLRRNLSYTDMIMEIQKFSARTDHEHVDMCVVAVMSHGRHGLVAAADGREIETEWVLRQFNNEGCPQLRGKPKFFILQSCRGDEADFGVMPKVNFPDSGVQSDARVVCQPPGAGYKEVSWEDILVAYATLPGYVANRDIFRGTWFIECLCKVFMENAHNLEIREMLDIVAQKLKQFESDKGTKQSCAYEVRNFYKKLYFNP